MEKLSKIQVFTGCIFMLVLVLESIEGCGKRWEIGPDLACRELVAPDGMTYLDGTRTLKGIWRGIPATLKENVWTFLFYSSAFLYLAAWGGEVMLQKRKR